MFLFGFFYFINGTLSALRPWCSHLHHSDPKSGRAWNSGDLAKKRLLEMHVSLLKDYALIQSELCSLYLNDENFDYNPYILGF